MFIGYITIIRGCWESKTGWIQLLLIFFVEIFVELIIFTLPTLLLSIPHQRHFLEFIHNMWHITFYKKCNVSNSIPCKNQNYIGIHALQKNPNYRVYLTWNVMFTLKCDAHPTEKNIHLSGVMLQSSAYRSITRNICC